MTKRAIFIKSPNAAWLKIASTLKDKHDITPSVWVSSVDTFHAECQKLFSNTKFYSHRDAIRAIPPSWRQRTNCIVDSATLARNATFEPVFNNMIDRWSSNLANEPYLKRRLYYIELLQLWYDILAGENVDLVVMPTIPHRVYDFTAYIVAKDLGIPFLMLDHTGELLIHENGTRSIMHYFTPDLQFRDKYVSSKLSHLSAQKSNELQKYISTLSGGYDQVIPSYLVEKNRKHEQQRVLNWIKSISTSLPLFIQYIVAELRLRFDRNFVKPEKLNFNFANFESEITYDFDSLYGILKWKKQVAKRASNGKKFYEKNSTIVDLDKKFVYLASHFQPEKTTTTDANIFQWQELIVEILDSSIPKDWVILFKEHPSNFRKPFSIASIIDRQYYERLLRISDKVRFVPFDTDPLQLIDRSQFVASATGTSSWQAATRGKPAIGFGDVWFGACPAVKRVTTIKECKEFVSRLNQDAAFDASMLVDFLARLETFAGSYDWARKNGSPITEKESGELRKQTVDDFCSDLVYAYKHSTQ